MTRYIDKAAIVAEIERRRKLVSDPILSGNDLMIGERNALFDLLSLLDTLEVKEMDLEKEYKDFVEEDPVYNKLVNGIVGKAIAKHFFELGLKAQKGE